MHCDFGQFLTIQRGPAQSLSCAGPWTGSVMSNPNELTPLRGCVNLEDVYSQALLSGKSDLMEPIDESTLEAS